jgi:hypothetical protein
MTPGRGAHLRPGTQIEDTGVRIVLAGVLPLAI